MKKNLFLINEEEKQRILGMHETATKRVYLSEQTPAPATPQPETKVLNDRDYAYKKEGEKYFFKLQPNPASEGAKKLKQANKYLNWTEATGKGLEAIKKLSWGKSEGLATLPATAVNPVSPSGNTASNTPTGTTPVSGGGGQPQLALGNVGTAEKSMPKIKSLDPTKQSQVAAWSQTPSGKYILSLPADQREAGLDNLDRVRGDKQTRELKKEIRIALGMPADTKLGRLGQGVQGAVQGFKQGVQGNVPPQQ